MEIVPFVRVDYYDTTFQESDPDFDLPSFVVPTIGLTYRPIPQVVFKFDYQYERPSTGAIANRWSAWAICSSGATSPRCRGICRGSYQRTGQSPHCR